MVGGDGRRAGNCSMPSDSHWLYARETASVSGTGSATIALCPVTAIGWPPWMVVVVGKGRRRGTGTLAGVEPARRGPVLECRWSWWPRRWCRGRSRGRCWHLLTPLEYQVVIPSMALECTMVFIRTQINPQAHGYRCSFYPVKGFIVSTGKRENQLGSNLTKIDR